MLQHNVRCLTDIPKEPARKRLRSNNGEPIFISNGKPVLPPINLQLRRANSTPEIFRNSTRDARLKRTKSFDDLQTVSEKEIKQTETTKIIFDDENENIDSSFIKTESAGPAVSVFCLPSSRISLPSIDHMTSPSTKKDQDDDQSVEIDIEDNSLSTSSSDTDEDISNKMQGANKKYNPPPNSPSIQAQDSAKPPKIQNGIPVNTDVWDANNLAPYYPLHANTRMVLMEEDLFGETDFQSKASAAMIPCRNFKAVIFDYNGTIIVDTYSIWKASKDAVSSLVLHLRKRVCEAHQNHRKALKRMKKQYEQDSCASSEQNPIYPKIKDMEIIMKELSESREKLMNYENPFDSFSHWRTCNPCSFDEYYHKCGFIQILGQTLWENEIRASALSLFQQFHAYWSMKTASFGPQFLSFIMYLNDMNVPWYIVSLHPIKQIKKEIRFLVNKTSAPPEIAQNIISHIVPLTHPPPVMSRYAVYYNSQNTTPEKSVSSSGRSCTDDMPSITSKVVLDGLSNSFSQNPAAVQQPPPPPAATPPPLVSNVFQLEHHNVGIKDKMVTIEKILDDLQNSLGIEEDDVLSIGDSVGDVEVAARLGMRFCGVHWGCGCRETLINKQAYVLAETRGFDYLIQLVDTSRRDKISDIMKEQQEQMTKAKISAEQQQKQQEPQPQEQPAHKDSEST